MLRRYIRLPLVLSFIATDERIHTLRSDTLRNIVESVLFEPGRYLSVEHASAPECVPARDNAQLATVYGYLLQELAASPEAVMVPMCDLVRQAVGINSGSESSNAPIILWVLRTAARVLTAAAFLLRHHSGTHVSVKVPLRGVDIPDATFAQLKGLARQLEMALHSETLELLRQWCEERVVAARAKPATLDAHTRVMCNLHGHILLLFRSATELDQGQVLQVLTSFMFLSARHTWNVGVRRQRRGEASGMDIPETELFEVVQEQRAALVAWLEDGKLPRESLDAVLNAVYHEVASKRSNNYVWGHIRGRPMNRGRYAAVQDGTPWLGVKEAPQMSDGQQAVEFNLQIMQLVLRGEVLSALDEDMALDKSLRRLLREDAEDAEVTTKQAITVGSHEERQSRYMVNEKLLVEQWNQFEKLAEVVNDRDYNVDELGDTETWMGELFEPLRKRYFVRGASLEDNNPLPEDIAFFLPDQELAEGSTVGYLTAAHPKKGCTWKEVFLYRTLGVVHVYSVQEHGRQFYRRLEYTTNAKLSLHELQPKTNDRYPLGAPPDHPPLLPWTTWGRHEAYTEAFKTSLEPQGGFQPPPYPSSIVVYRARPEASQHCTEPEDTGAWCDSEWGEMMMPAQTLEGVLPAALMLSHDFFQDNGGLVYACLHTPACTHGRAYVHTHA